MSARTERAPSLFLFKNSLNTAKNISQGYYTVRVKILFHPYQSTFGHNEFFFFRFFLLSKSFPKPQHIEI